MIGLYCRVFERSQNVALFKKRIVCQNFLMRCARPQKADDVRNPYPQATDAGAPATFAGFDGNSIKQTCFQGKLLHRIVCVSMRLIYIQGKGAFKGTSWVYVPWQDVVLNVSLAGDTLAA